MYAFEKLKFLAYFLKLNKIGSKEPYLLQHNEGHISKS